MAEVPDDDVVPIMRALFDIRAMVADIHDYLLGEDEEEEKEDA